MRTPSTLAAAALVALSLTACTTSHPEDLGTAVPPSTAAPAPTAPAATSAPAADAGKGPLEAAVRAYSKAYLTGDGTAAYELLSKRCQGRITKPALTTLAATAAQVYGDVAIKSLTVDQLAGSLARVTYTYPVATLNQTGQPWTREGGAWHYDAC